MVRYKNTVVSWGKTASILKISQKAVLLGTTPAEARAGTGPPAGCAPLCLRRAHAPCWRPGEAGARRSQQEQAWLEVRAFLLGLAVTTQRAAQQSCALPGFLFLLQGAVYSIFLESLDKYKCVLPLLARGAALKRVQWSMTRHQHSSGFNFPDTNTSRSSTDGNASSVPFHHLTSYCLHSWPAQLGTQLVQTISPS